eukprot:TRINITY_DN3043_c0_g1_i1.p1 TRINITY_DN3043_c0_g1~~TRINITY_DN3043_c0_g1_i1.p1  ORF type:complete len:502 (+),score=96.70 TRINITY_DN3043_c0_g1_i1:3-1508(+)
MISHFYKRKLIIIFAIIVLINIFFYVRSKQYTIENSHGEIMVKREPKVAIDVREEMTFNFPKKIHFTFDEKFEDIPKKSKYLKNIKKWGELNPDFEVKYYNDQDRLEYLKKYFAHIPKLVNIYLDVPLKVMRADIFRYLVLYNEGGLYSDIDMYPNKPIKEWIKGYEEKKIDLLVAIEYGKQELENYYKTKHMYRNTPKFVQSIMLTTKQNKILERVVNNLVPLYERVENNICKKNYYHVLECGGPFYWSDMIFDHMIENVDKNFDIDMVLKKENETNLIGNVLIVPRNRFEKELNKDSFAQHQKRASWVGNFNKGIQILLSNNNNSTPLRQGLLNFREDLFEEAIEEFKKVSVKEELYAANYIIGMCYKNLKGAETDVTKYLLNAHLFANENLRVEPLIELVLYLYFRETQNKCQKVVLYSNMALFLKFDQTHYKFAPIHINLLDFLHDSICTCAHPLGEYEMGERFCKKFLESKPNDLRVKNNLLAYQHAIKENQKLKK